MSLIERYADKIRGVISCYDRIVIQGILPGFCFAEGMTSYLYAHQLTQNGISCHLLDNAFTDIEDFEKAQTLSDDLDIAKRHHRLDEYTGLYCPVIVKLLAKLRLPSFFSATTEETHQIIRDNIRFSPLYAGAIQGAGNTAQDKMDRG